jgi:hypothetical protein
VKVARYAWLLGVASACRIGGPSADPKAYVTFPSDAADAEDATSLPTESGGDDASTPPAGRDATTGPDAHLDASSAADGRSHDGGDAACMAFADGGACNPVTNSGCVLLQCDIDTSQTTPAGICVAASPFPNAPGSPCTQGSGPVSCQPQYTCYAGTCQKVCLCDGDCSGGTCCSGTAGMTGFGLCGACH